MSERSLNQYDHGRRGCMAPMVLTPALLRLTSSLQIPLSVKILDLVYSHVHNKLFFNLS